MRRQGRHGFTLIELIAALALTGFAIVGAWGLLQQVGDNRDRVVDATARDARTANGVRLLRELVFSAEAGVTAAERFTGTPQAAQFVTWCDAPGGWRARCRVSLAVASVGGDSSVLNVVTSGGEAPLPLTRARGSSALRYADRNGEDLTWVERWIDGITPPAAVALLTGGGRDTIVMSVGIAR